MRVEPCLSPASPPPATATRTTSRTGATRTTAALTVALTVALDVGGGVAVHGVGSLGEEVSANRTARAATIVFPERPVLGVQVTGEDYLQKGGNITRERRPALFRLALRTCAACGPSARVVRLTNQEKYPPETEKDRRSFSWPLSGAW